MLVQTQLEVGGDLDHRAISGEVSACPIFIASRIGVASKDDKQKQQTELMELYKREKDQSAGRLPAGPGADPGVLRALIFSRFRPGRVSCALYRNQT